MKKYPKDVQEFAVFLNPLVGARCHVPYQWIPKISMSLIFTPEANATMVLMTNNGSNDRLLAALKSMVNGL